MWVNLFIEDKKVDRFLEDNGYQEESLVCILKKEYGFKSGYEIRKKYDLLTSCLGEKVCWKNEAEYREILVKLERLLGAIKADQIPKYLRGKSLMRIWVNSGGRYKYGYPYDNSIRFTLEIHKREYIIKSWLQENF